MTTGTAAQPGKACGLRGSLRLTFSGVTGDVGVAATGRSLLFSPMLALIAHRDITDILVKWYKPSPRKTAMARNTCAARNVGFIHNAQSRHASMHVSLLQAGFKMYLPDTNLAAGNPC